MSVTINMVLTVLVFQLLENKLWIIFSILTAGFDFLLVLTSILIAGNNGITWLTVKQVGSFHQS